jgi:hypothetical protein
MAKLIKPSQKQIKSLIKEMEDLKFEGPERLAFPHLTIKYEIWYTKALRVVQLLVPERLEDFVSAYKKENSDGVSYSSYTIQDYLLGIKGNHSPKAELNPELLFQRLILRQVGILSSALQDKPVPEETPGSLPEVELYNRELDKAQKLFGMGKKLPAGIIAGVILESYLKWLWKKRNLRIDANQYSLREINDFLLRFESYQHSTAFRIKELISLAESCLDPQKKNPSKSEIEDLIARVRKVLGSGP